MITAIDHINIVVRDLEKMTRFYTEVLGLRETKRARLKGEWIEAIVGLAGVEAEVVFVEPPGGGPRIELLHYVSPQGSPIAACSAPNTPGLRHIAVRVQGIDAAAERLRAAGVNLFGAPVTVPDSAVKHEAGEKKLLYFLDPEGVLLELTEYV